DVVQAQQDQKYGFVAYHTLYVQDWKNTGDVSRAIRDRLSEKEDYSYLKTLYLEWKSAQQQNGILLMVSGLVGIVFFTFAASFVYFRFYSDLARDEQQYRMIAKVGLSKKELGTIITKQLVIM
ncbi:ABC transporter permease, partial [Clostridium perfringens]